MTEGKKCSLEPVAPAVNHLVTNGDHLAITDVTWFPLINTDRFSLETRVFMSHYLISQLSDLELEFPQKMKEKGN